MTVSEHRTDLLKKLRQIITDQAPTPEAKQASIEALLCAAAALFLGGKGCRKPRGVAFAELAEAARQSFEEWFATEQHQATEMN